MAVDDAGFRRQQCADAGQLHFHGARGIAADHLDAFDAVFLRLRQDGLDLGQFRLIGGDDELAAFAVRHAVRGAELVEHAPAAHAVDRAQRAGRIIQAAMDHFGVARRHAIGDAAGRLGHGHVVAGKRRGARDGQPDHAGADHQNLHCLPRVIPGRAKREPGIHNPSAGIMDSGLLASLGPGMTI